MRYTLYRPSLEQVETLQELELIVSQIIKQYELAHFQEENEQTNWADLGEMITQEYSDDPELMAVAYWLYVAEEQRCILMHDFGL